MGDFLAVIPDWIKVATLIGQAFVALSLITKNESDNKYAQWVMSAINFFAGNFGRSKNA